MSPGAVHKILVAIDGSPGGQKALETAIELAKLTRAELHALTVEGKLPAYAATIGEDQFFGTVARLARDQAREEGVDIQVDVLPGHAAELIVRHAGKGDFDLVVVGHKGHFLEDYLPGSTADRVAHWANLGLLALLLAAKIVPKLFGVYPLARRYAAPHGIFTTLLMSTGLTFGTISSLYGLNTGIINKTQFSLLITVVVLSAIIPTAIAQRFFQPEIA